MREGKAMNERHCKCGAKIVFAEDVENGETIPLDAVAPTYSYWFEDGKAKCSRAGRSVCVSHFATCKNANEFSRTGKRK